MDPRMRQDAKLALVVCKGIISLYNDSIRKYVKDDYKHGHKHRNAKRAAAKGTKTSAGAQGTRKRKSRGKRAAGAPASRKRRGEIIDESDEVGEGVDTDADESTPKRGKTSPAAGGTPKRNRHDGRAAGGRARGKSNDDCVEDSHGEGSGAEEATSARGRRVKLPAGSSASETKYVSIVTSNMTQENKAEVIEMMLSTTQTNKNNTKPMCSNVDSVCALQ